jgi:acetoacetate decarboxylase
MGFVKTPEEIACLREIMAAPRAVGGEMVSIEFVTRQEIVERLLPPGLASPPQPTGIAYVGRWSHSNAGPFEGGAVYLRARHGDLEGDYCLAMPMSTERAILFGREMLGEPKKLCTVAFERDGKRVRGQLLRGGRPIVAIEGTLSQPVPVQRFESAAFHYKYSHRVDGRGLEHDPLLVRVVVRHELRRAEAGAGSLRLGSTPHDPLGEIEVVKVGSVLYAEGNLRGQASVVARVDATAFLPYAYGKIDDWSVIDTGDPSGGL